MLDISSSVLPLELTTSLLFHDIQDYNLTDNMSTSFTKLWATEGQSIGGYSLAQCLAYNRWAIKT